MRMGWASRPQTPAFDACRMIKPSAHAFGMPTFIFTAAASICLGHASVCQNMHQLLPIPICPAHSPPPTHCCACERALPRWVGEPPPKPPATDACRTIKAPVLPLVCQHLHPVLPALRYPVSIRVKRLAYGGIESGIQGTQSLAGGCRGGGPPLPLPAQGKYI